MNKVTNEIIEKKIETLNSDIDSLRHEYSISEKLGFKQQSYYFDDKIKLLIDFRNFLTSELIE